MKKIVDNKGQTLTVTNLKAAIEQAKTFAGYDRYNGSPILPPFVLERQAYWQDILEKLQVLQAGKK
ncbi:hypothetical protein [Pedobacter frigoris]|uniref:hypothetical protein n=1 Tax=Pedobacter frigoris TaxID=2571272 RepID=UPI002930F5C4|nr:hypothetical protein [Pedobacter frigoris]